MNRTFVLPSDEHSFTAVVAVVTLVVVVIGVIISCIRVVIKDSVMLLNANILWISFTHRSEIRIDIIRYCRVHYVSICVEHELELNYTWI